MTWSVRIQQLYHEMCNIKHIFFTWVRGHTGAEGKENADSLTKGAAQDHQLNARFLLFPHSYLKYKLTQNLIQNWQERWDQSAKCRHAYKFFQKIIKNVHIISRELIIFLTNNGSFQKYFYKISKTCTPMCIYSHLFDSLHYISSCPLTQPYHIKRDARLSLQH